VSSSSSPQRFRIQPQWAGFAFLYLAISLLALRTAAQFVDEPVHYGQIESNSAMVDPVALWLGFRESQSARIEAATTALWGIAAVCVCLGTFAGPYFP